MKEGIELGKEAEKKENIIAAIQQGILTNEQIAALFKVSLSYVEELKRQM